VRFRIDSWLARLSRGQRNAGAAGSTAIQRVNTSVGALRLFDSRTSRPCVVLVPDGPNVIEHYEGLIGRLAHHVRVVCFDMPGFGFSLPQPNYMRIPAIVNSDSTRW
jgi:pimeloyl-ACP methyl ester carboxylesterase